MDDLDPEAQRRISSFIRGLEAVLHPRHQRDPVKSQPKEKLIGDSVKLDAAAHVKPTAKRLKDVGLAAWVEYEVIPGASVVIAALERWLVEGDPTPIRSWLGFPAAPGRPSLSTKARVLEVLRWHELRDQGRSLEAAAVELGRDQRTFSRWLEDERVRELVDFVERLTPRLDAIAQRSHDDKVREMLDLAESIAARFAPPLRAPKARNRKSRAE